MCPTWRDLIKQPNPPPQLVLAAAEALDRLGIPQDERPVQDPTLPKPAITAAELRQFLKSSTLAGCRPTNAARATNSSRGRRRKPSQGSTDDKYRLGSFDIQPGDWLLMRNPSPYNLFTELSPGLFTHVGVAAIENGQ